MRAVLTLVACGFGLGCGGSPAAGPDAAPPVTYNCAADTRGETYVSGLEAMGKSSVFDVKLMAMDPEPPSRGNNTWNVEIDDATTGQPLPGLGSGMTVTPFMPDHQHGSPIKVDIADDGSGQYTLTPLNLWMPGVWTVTIAASDGSAFDKAVYTFCLPE
jgi:hypothetical protein|nr:FixH family protein [Kofleriaceae bacterium]